MTFTSDSDHTGEEAQPFSPVDSETQSDNSTTSESSPLIGGAWERKTALLGFDQVIAREANRGGSNVRIPVARKGALLAPGVSEQSTSDFLSSILREQRGEFDKQDEMASQRIRGFRPVVEETKELLSEIKSGVVELTSVLDGTVDLVVPDLSYFVGRLQDVVESIPQHFDEAKIALAIEAIVSSAVILERISQENDNNFDLTRGEAAWNALEMIKIGLESTQAQLAVALVRLQDELSELMLKVQQVDFEGKHFGDKSLYEYEGLFPAERAG